MTKTHDDIIIATEEKLFEAMTSFDVDQLRGLLDPNIVYTNEIGEVSAGFDSLKILNPDILKIDAIEVAERKISHFNNVAIVNTIETRQGKYFGIDFKSTYRLTRTWKFNGRRWILIATTIIAY